MYIKCRNCGVVFASQFCPNCGMPAATPAPPFKLRNKPNFLPVIAVILFIGLAFAIINVVGKNININGLGPGAGRYEISDTSTSKKEQLTDVVFDVTKFIVDDKRTVSEDELIEMLGEPESIDEWNYRPGNSIYQYAIRSLYYDDGKYEYKFHNDALRRITIDDEFNYSDKDDILPMFGLKEYWNTVIKDTNLAYRCTDCGIYEFWIYDMDSESKIINGIHISYDKLFNQ